MIVKFSRICFLILLAIIIDGCSTTSKDPAVVFKGQSAQQIYQKGEVALAKRKYKDAIQAFEGLDALYPFTEHSEQAQMDLVYSYYQDENYASAVAAADEFIRTYPRSSHIDYVYYLKGLSNFNQDRGWFLRYSTVDISMRDPGSMHQAYGDFKQLIQLYPNSRYAADARQRMIYLRNMFAKYELHVADYYYQRKAYVAAANRADYIVKHYDGAPQVEDALGLMVKAYRKLGLTELADQTIQVLRLNYPNGNVLKELNQSK